MPAKKTKKSTRRGASQSKRRKSPYNPLACPSTWEEVCTKLNKWGDAWEIWGQDVLSELDDIKKRIAFLPPTGTGPGPTDATQPPQSPFKK